MYYLVYKITNLINKKMYIGVHQTKNKDDGYMGSGLLINRAIKKYGVGEFRKEILFEAKSIKEMFSKEQELVEIGPHTYNISAGGIGGISNENQIKGNKAFLKRFNSDIEFQKYCLENNKKNLKKALIANKEKYSEKGGWSFSDKQHTFETKKKMSLSHKGKHVGKLNSQFGTMWITDGEENRKIRKEESIPDGFCKGRNIMG